MSERVKFKDFSKKRYQQIQGLNTEQKMLEIQYEHENQFNKMSVLNVKQFQKISKN